MTSVTVQKCTCTQNWIKIHFAIILRCRLWCPMWDLRFRVSYKESSYIFQPSHVYYIQVLHILSYLMSSFWRYSAMSALFMMLLLPDEQTLSHPANGQVELTTESNKTANKAEGQLHIRLLVHKSCLHVVIWTWVFVVKEWKLTTVFL